MDALSENIIRKLNAKFGVEGHPHMKGDYSDSPCFGWAVYDKEFVTIGWDDDLIETLMETRDFLKDDPVFAYFGLTPWKTAYIDPDRTYLSDHVFGIIVAPVTNQFDVLRIEETAGMNFELDTDDIIEKLQYFDQEFGIDILSASMIGVNFKVINPPQGQAALALREWVDQYWAPEYEQPADLNRVAMWWD
jgi:hypothetical protein